MAVLGLTAALLAAASAATLIVDPLFHFHAPLNGVRYADPTERYGNDGILKHFRYDAIITGSSMTENFRATELDELFGVTTVKVPYSGSTLAETANALSSAYSSGNTIRLVVRSLDLYALASPADALDESFDYPTYLYDDVPWNDYKYLLNKDVFVGNTLPSLFSQRKSGNTLDFDTYSRWADNFLYGREEVLKRYTRPAVHENRGPCSEETREMIRVNLEKNVVSFAREHPETEFCLFFPPYSIVYWDQAERNGSLETLISMEMTAAQTLIPYENIHLFSFGDDFALTTDLNNYKDLEHYSSAINSLILRRMRSGEYELTADNYECRYREIGAFYASYDYEALLAE